MRLVQLELPGRGRRVARVEGPALRLLTTPESVTPHGVYGLARTAIASGTSLAQVVERAASPELIDYAEVIAEQRLLSPFDHPDPAQLLVSGTGLTHLGSAETRAGMHQAETRAAAETDSMKLFRLGVEGGKPTDGSIGVQPEWFYKGDGSCLTRPGHPFLVPDFSLDASEEPEIVGLYVVSDTGAPYRVGFALGNELSDHVTERQNYLYLAHSKLRPCSIGPELSIGELPHRVTGESRILRGGRVIWRGEFQSGEENMSHRVSGLEHHHFKYSMFRRPGTAHVHFFGTATLSFAAGVRTEPGDVFEIESPSFGAPLRNGWERAPVPPPCVRVL